MCKYQIKWILTLSWIPYIFLLLESLAIVVFQTYPNAGRNHCGKRRIFFVDLSVGAWEWDLDQWRAEGKCGVIPCKNLEKGVSTD